MGKIFSKMKGVLVSVCLIFSAVVLIAQAIGVISIEDNLIYTVVCLYVIALEPISLMGLSKTIDRKLEQNDLWAFISLVCSLVAVIILFKYIYDKNFQTAQVTFYISLVDGVALTISALLNKLIKSSNIIY